MEGLQPMLDTFLKDHPEEYPEIFEGVKDLGKLKSAYSIAGFIVRRDTRIDLIQLAVIHG